MTRPPKAKIIKMHKLLDDALALWPDVQEWARERARRAWDVDYTWVIDQELHRIVGRFRDMRHEVEE
jgi:hypothetical protein